VFFINPDNEINLPHKRHQFSVGYNLLYLWVKNNIIF